MIAKKCDPYTYLSLRSLRIKTDPFKIMLFELIFEINNSMVILNYFFSFCDLSATTTISKLT